jgi:hypothetical protein
VAMMASSRVTVRVPPVERATSMVLGIGEGAVAVNLADRFLLQLIAFFFMRKCTPLTRPSATYRLRSVDSAVVEEGLAGDAELLGLVREDVR